MGGRSASTREDFYWPAKKKKSILCLLRFFAVVLVVVLCCVFLLLSMDTLGMYYQRSIPLGLAVSDNEQRAASAISS